MCRLAQFAHTMATGGARCGLCTPAPTAAPAPRIRYESLQRRPVASAPWTRPHQGLRSELTSPPPHMTPEEFRQHGRAVIDWIADYWERIESMPVASTVAPGDIRAMLPDAAPEEAEPFENLLADLDRVVMPGVTHWQHPGWFAYFPANNSRRRCWPTRCPPASG